MLLFLTGYRGSGKSTVAPLLAMRLDCKSIDTDRMIEELAGKSILEIFKQDGEPEFRKLESQVIGQIVMANPAPPVPEETQADKPTACRIVVSLGGGAIMNPENRKRIAHSGQTVFLRARAEVLWDRIRGDESSRATRPSLTGDDGLTEVRRVLESRADVYADCADFTIDTDDLSVNAIADAVAGWFQSVDNR